MLTADPWEVFAAGRQRRVPLLAGWNSAEIKLPSATVAALTADLRRQFPNDEAAARKAYAATNAREARRAATALASDNFIGYNTWKWIEMHAATSGAAAYRYLFDQIFPTATGAPPADDPGAAHATDIEYVFSALDTRKLAWRDADRRVADLMGSYWTNFAKTGNPNGPGLPAWPAWRAGGAGQLMRINATSQAEPEGHRDRYELLDTIQKRKRAAK